MSSPSPSPSQFPSASPIVILPTPTPCDASTYEPNPGLHYGLVAAGVFLAILPGYARLIYERDSLRTKWFYVLENAARGVVTGWALYPALPAVLAANCGNPITELQNLSSWVLVSVVVSEVLLDANAFVFGRPWVEGTVGYDAMRWKLSKTNGFPHTCCYMILVPSFLALNVAVLVGNHVELRDVLPSTPFWPTWVVGIINVGFVVLLVIPVVTIGLCGVCYLGGEVCGVGCRRFKERHFRKVSPLRALWTGSKIINLDLLGLIVALYTNQFLAFSWAAELVLDVGLLVLEKMGGFVTGG